jgi:uncharacterized iron-regulated membrane protein
MVSIDSTGAPVQAAAPASTNKLYLAAWRWHFYAGLYVIPFFAVLAITGMAMAWIAYIDGRDGERIAVQPQAVAQAVSAQADAALAAIPGGTLRQYVAPRAADLAAIFRVDLDGKATMIAVDPYTATVLAEFPAAAAGMTSSTTFTATSCSASPVTGCSRSRPPSAWC